MHPSSAETFDPNGTAGVSNAWHGALREILVALKWRGEDRHLYEAMPQGAGDVDCDRFREILANLGFPSLHRRGSPKMLDARWLPAIYLDRKGDPHLLIDETDQDEAPDREHAMLLFQPAGNEGTDQQTPFVTKVIRRYRPTLVQAFWVSLLITIVALAPSLFNRALYDNVIASGAKSGVNMLLAGVLAALACELVLRSVRARNLAHIGARLDHFVSVTVFERLMALPPAFTERAAVSSQIARLRDFDSIREFCTGPLAPLIFELPLVLTYVAAMIYVGGWLALIPGVLVIAYGILLVSMYQGLKERARNAANAASARHEFLLETVTKLPAIRLAGLEAAWLERFRNISARASDASFSSSFYSQILEVKAYVLMTLSGVATLGFGVVAVVGQHMTTGDLIASMMLIWRIVAPIQLACASMSRVQQLAASKAQVERLFSMPPEHDFRTPASAHAKLLGGISFRRVSLRYLQDSEPALLGVTFDVKPGEVVAIAGSNGSGKSSILKLILGIYHAQAGAVLLDGVDVRQFDPVYVRQSIAYVPQIANFFSGTLKENLLLASPTASDVDCMTALSQTAAATSRAQLEEPMDTSGASGQKVNLARAYLRPAPIVLLDEATHGLGPESDAVLVHRIAELRGKSTVLICTHREDHMRLADRLMVIEKGELTMAGPPDKVLEAMHRRRA
jgi:ATP-binding cassette subfamily C protein/ATP-binding cassette subfamily C protein LapB